MQCSMLVADVFSCGALMLCWASLCTALHVLHGQRVNQAPKPTVTGDKGKEPSFATTVSNLSLCFIEDLFTELREGVGSDGKLTNRTMALFGVCTVSDNSSAVLLELAKETNKNQRHGLEVLHPAGVLLREDERGALRLTFDFPRSPLLMPKSVLLLAFERPLTGVNLDVTFTSHLLHPNAQSTCISGETQYIMLTGKTLPLQIITHQKWRISIETDCRDNMQSLKDILISGKSGTNTSMTPLLLLSGERGTDTSSSVASSQTSSFLCELKRFLVDVLPQDRPVSPPLQLRSLQSLSPLKLGLSSSEAVLAGLMNSSALTVFSLSSRGSVFQGPPGELALSPALLEELRQRLEQTVLQVMVVIREEEMGRRAMERLERLKELSAFPKTEEAGGESQYRALLLLKALQTVARAYKVQRGLRVTRAAPNSHSHVCGLRSLTVSLQRYLVGPNTANIYNCDGSCAFPLVNANNHAVLLNSHIESENADERPPCCVPVVYEDLEVVELNEHGTFLSIKPDMVAKECGCR